MKTLRYPIVILFILLVVNSTFGQIAYYDAVKLSSYVVDGKFKTDEVSFKEVCSILLKYAKKEPKRNPAVGVEQSDLFEEFKENPFIKSYIGNVVTQESTLRFGAANKALTYLGERDVTTIVDGLAQFLVKRTKQELTATFFERLDTFLDSHKDIQILFPETTVILHAAGDEIYNYQVYLSALREAFEEDLSILFSSGFTWTKSDAPWINEIYSSQDKRPYYGLKTGFFIGRELQKNRHPGDVLKDLSALHLINAEPKTDKIDLSVLDKNLVPVLQTFNVFSQSLRSNDSKHYWIQSSEFSAFENADVLTIYFGLIYQNADNIKFSSGDTLRGLLSKMAIEKKELEILVQELQTELGIIQQTIDDLQTADNKRATLYFELIKSTVNVIKTIQTTKLLEGNIMSYSQSSAVFYYIDHISKFWSYVESKSYNAAVFESYLLLDTVLYNKKAEIKTYLKYGTFIASVAEAKTPEGVEAAIEAAVLPSGSASIKRKTKSNISLNAYVGLTPGYEWKDDSFKKGKFSFGVSAPIGVAFSCGKFEKTGSKYKEKGSRTFFLSLVDLGAVTAYRFNDENDSEPLPKLTLSNVFAPGMYFVRGLPNLPISLGFGGQLGPQVRKITNTAVVDNTGVNYSLKIFVAVDIPLLNFRTVPRD